MENGAISHGVSSQRLFSNGMPARRGVRARDHDGNEGSRHSVGESARRPTPHTYVIVILGIVIVILGIAKTVDR
jgi:hypothetical protein